MTPSLQESGLSRIRLLVVDDDTAGRYLKKRILETAGWEVDAVVDGASALTYAEHHGVDLVVLDVKLPDIIGTEVCRRLKAKRPDILVLQTSATFVNSADRVHGLEAGADAYLTEPVERDEFIATVRALLRAKTAEEALRRADARSAAFVRATPDAMLGANAEGKIDLWNPGAERIFGYTTEEALGQPANFLVPTDVIEVRAVFNRAIKGEVITEESVRRRKDGVLVPVLVSAAPIYVAERLTGVAAFFRDISDRKAAELQLQTRTAKLESLLTNAPLGLAFFDRKHRYMRVNEALAEINGIAAPDHIGKTIGELLPANAKSLDPLLDEIFVSGNASGNVEISGETPREPGVVRYWLTGFYPVYDGSEIIAVGVWMTEITDRKRAEQQKQLLVNELNHRVKNTLTVVQAIANQTFKGSTFDRSAAHSFDGRLAALATAHDVLTRNNWESADLKEIVRQALAPYELSGRARLHIDGPNLRLLPKVVLSLSMALHELGTNAAKYGALSTERGSLDIAWKIVAHKNGDHLHLEWTESGGPPVKEPTQCGFGSQLISTLLKQDLKADLSLRYAPSGVVCSFSAPLSALSSSPQRS